MRPRGAPCSCAATGRRRPAAGLRRRAESVAAAGEAVRGAEAIISFVSWLGVCWLERKGKAGRLSGGPGVLWGQSDDTTTTSRALCEERTPATAKSARAEERAPANQTPFPTSGKLSKPLSLSSDRMTARLAAQLLFSHRSSVRMSPTIDDRRPRTLAGTRPDEYEYTHWIH